MHVNPQENTCMRTQISSANKVRQSFVDQLILHSVNFQQKPYQKPQSILSVLGLYLPQGRKGKELMTVWFCPITACCHWLRNTMKRAGQMEWFKCIPTVITEKFHWLLRYKHAAVKINKLPHPCNYCSLMQMQLEWIPAYPGCCYDLKKWTVLLCYSERELLVFHGMFLGQHPPGFPV